MRIQGFQQMAEQIQKERGVSKAALIDAVQAALLSACRKRFVQMDNLEVRIEEDETVHVWSKRTVVAKVSDAELEISKKDAKKINPNAKAGEVVEVDVTPEDFGRLAAQTAKQVIIQRIREAEKETVFDEFKDKIGKVVTGMVQRREFGGYLVNLGRIETFLTLQEQIYNEHYRPKDKIKVFVVEVKRTPKGPVIVISRTHPGLVRSLFESEVPEIAEGIIEIKSVAREAGRRTKLAVHSKDPNVGAVGTCIGHMGSRVQNVIKELGNERIDIIEWSEDPKKYITNALSPAKISEIKLNTEDRQATIVVAEDQLSLAIGKEGQNVRLAAKITGWKIDIVSAKELKEREEKPKKEAAAAEVVKEKSKIVKEAKEVVSRPDVGTTAPPQEKPETIKIAELAAECGIGAKQVISALKELGVEAKRANSSVPYALKDKLLEKLKGESSA